MTSADTMLRLLVDDTGRLDDAVWSAVLAPDADPDVAVAAFDREHTPPWAIDTLTARWAAVDTAVRAAAWRHVDTETRVQLIRSRQWPPNAAVLASNAGEGTALLDQIEATPSADRFAELAANRAVTRRVRLRAARKLAECWEQLLQQGDVGTMRAASLRSAFATLTDTTGGYELLADAIAPIPKCSLGELTIWLSIARAVPGAADADALVQRILGPDGEGVEYRRALFGVVADGFSVDGDARDKVVAAAKDDGSDAAARAVKAITGRRPPRRSKVWDEALEAAGTGDLTGLERLAERPAPRTSTSTLRRVVADPRVPGPLAAKLVLSHRSREGFGSTTEVDAAVLDWRDDVGYQAALVLADPRRQTITAATGIGSDAARVLTELWERNITDSRIEMLSATPGANLDELRLATALDMAAASPTIAATLRRAAGPGVGLTLEVIDGYEEATLGEFAAVIALTEPARR